jgi:hypothetical protein
VIRRVAEIDLTAFGRCGSCGASLRVFDHRAETGLRQRGASLPRGPDDDEGVFAAADDTFECPRCGAHGRVVDGTVVCPG